MNLRAWSIAALVISATCSRAATPEFLQAEADALVEADRAGGVILALVHPDGKVEGATAGRQSAGEPIPVNGRVRIGSGTKTFVATLVLQLVDEGKVDLDASARSYIPDPPLPAGVTVRDLS